MAVSKKNTNTSTIFKSLTAKMFASTVDGVYAYGSVVIDEAFAVNIIVRDTRKGPMVCFPNHKGGNGEWRDDAFPITKEARNAIISVVKDVCTAEGLID